MRYTTSDYLTDSVWFYEPLSHAARKAGSGIYRLYVKISRIDYDYYIARILENLPTGLLIIFLGALGCFAMLKYTEGKYGNRISSIVTPSMSPAIPSGSLIFSRPESNYKKGDIISYIELTDQGVGTGKILTHRVVAKDMSGRVITKGDANSDPDPVLVTEKQILGKVYGVIPFVGYVEFLLGTLPGFLVLVAAPALMVVKQEIEALKKEVD